MEIKVIKNKQTYERYLQEIERLFDAEIGTPDGDCLELLVTLVHAYEQKHHPIDPPDPIEAIQFRIDQNPSVKPALAKLFGRSHLSEILNRKRLLSLDQMRQLRTFGIPAEVLLTPYRRTRSRKKAKQPRRTKAASR